MHYTTSKFWECYGRLPKDVQTLADKNYELLKTNPTHPSLHFKKVNRYWSVRIGKEYRALGLEMSEGILLFWIGDHQQYNRLIGSS